MTCGRGYTVLKPLHKNTPLVLWMQGGTSYTPHNFFKLLIDIIGCKVVLPILYTNYLLTLLDARWCFQYSTQFLVNYYFCK